MEERAIIVKGDVIIGNRSELGYGIIANSLIAGERVIIGGDVLTNSDVRIDNWSSVSGEVQTDSDAYIGEFVNIEGRLSIKGNLDVGKSVTFKKGFEAKGSVAVRNPVPVIVFIYLYLMTLLRLENEEEVKKAMEELFEEDKKYFCGMMIPGRTKINLEKIKTDADIRIGKNCRLLGNVRSRSLSMGRNTTLFGSIRSNGNVAIGRDCTIHGSLISEGKITIERNCYLFSNLTGDNIEVHETARIDGKITAQNGVVIIKDDLEGFSDIERNIFYGFLMLE